MPITQRQVLLVRAALMFISDSIPDALVPAVRETWTDPTSHPIIARQAVIAWRDALNALSAEVNAITP